MRKIYQIFGWLITLTVPLLLFLSSARVIFSPLYLNYEYQLPKFPTDEFGFSTQDRVKYANLSLAYLFNDQGIEFLEKITLPGGSPLYNERELSHMDDVKRLIQTFMHIWYGLIGFFIITAIWSKLGKWSGIFWNGVAHGGWLTVGLIFAILAMIMFNFNEFFTQFHHLFFTGDSWLFYESDSLIRLFPLKLWSDGFTFVGIFSLTAGIVLSAVGHKLKSK